MVLEIIPILPPEIRPLVHVGNGQLISSDLNELYRRLIRRNLRFFTLKEVEAGSDVLEMEQRLIQEATDNLMDNGRRGQPVLSKDSNRPLKSLSDVLKGKEGRFRQNLLGKRVDYSGRSVIIVGPELKLYQCGLPKEMAIELFQPFVVHRLIYQGVAINSRAAKNLIQKNDKLIWEILAQVIKGYPILLNRATTLHRLGIQAFEPMLVKGQAIKLHPIVSCF
jgi:DNA-directed RNA polymerase subunit beta'